LPAPLTGWMKRRFSIQHRKALLQLAAPVIVVKVQLAIKLK
jgi:hypothetical protein